jgi:flavin reductase (DIM6/NTAB) family NADH-FMN oxidoreductase RutF
MDIDAASLAPRDAYALLTSLVVPRPIAWITTADGDHINVAPFSFFNALGSDPPMLTVSFAARRDGSDKDTLRLLRKTGHCCVHVVEEGALDAMNLTSAELPADESEAVRFGLATLPCARIPGVRLAAARAGMECRLVDVHRYGRNQAVGLAVLEVVAFFVADALCVAGAAPVRVDGEQLRPVARMGGNGYAFVGARPTRERPQL